MDAVEEDRAKELLIATAEEMNVADRDSFYEMTWGDLLDVAVQALARSNGWQDIATAPKDGTHVLLVDEYGERSAAWWGDKHGADSEYGTVLHDPHFCWLISDRHNDPIKLRMDPTHWQPLPEPPLDRLRGSEDEGEKS